MALALDRQQSIIFEEEVSFGARPAVPFDDTATIRKYFFIDPLEGEITETPTLVKMELADGSRGPSRKETVSKIVTFRAMFDIHPKNMGWLHKWASGTQVVVDSVLGLYRYTYPTPLNVDLKSFTMYVDSNNPDYWAAGQQLLPILGCKIGTMAVSASSGDDEQRRFRVELTGIGQKPQVVTNARIVVLTFGNLSGETITIVVNGVTTVLTEGVDFSAVTNNNTTATNIATAFNATTGLEAVSSTATVVVSVENGYNIESIITNSTIGDLTVVTETSDVLMAGPGLRFSKSLLFSSTNPTPYLFQNLINQWGSAGYTASNKWRSASVIIENVLEPRTYAKESAYLYLDDIFLRSQRVTFSFDKDFSDAVARIHNWRNSIEQNLNIRLTHKDPRLSNNDHYREEWTMPRSSIDDANPLISFSGGDEVTQRTFTGEALIDNESTDVANVATGTNHILNIDTAFVAGTSGDAEAIEFLTVSGGYLNAIRLKLKTRSPTETANLFMRIYTDDGASPSEPSALVPGGISNLVSAEILTEAYQSIFFDFPNRPKLDATTRYWFLIHTTSGGSLNMDAQGDTAGTGSHTVTTDGAQTWPSTPDMDDWDYEVYVNVLSAVVDLHVETNTTSLFPDST